MKKKQLQFFPKANILLEAKNQLDALLEHRPAKTGISICLAFLLISLIFVGSLYNRFPPKIPLFYSQPWGTQQLAYKIWFFLLIAVYFVFIIVNTRLASIFFKKNPFLSNILIWATTILGFLMFTTIIRITLVIL